MLMGLTNCITSRIGETDYVVDGITICGVCRKPKQYRLSTPLYGETGTIVPIMCDCEKQSLNREERFRRKEKFRHWLDEREVKSLQIGLDKCATFRRDDKSDQEATDICGRYVRNREKMLESNVGMIIYGPPRTGKSYHAQMIANALLAYCVPTLITSFPVLLSAMDRGFGNASVIANRLGDFDFLIIDDLGVERNTSLANERVFQVVDTRLRQKKPLIVTTNLSIHDMENAETIAHKRIYSRVLEMCSIPVHMENQRTKKTYEARSAEALALLYG